MASQSLGTGSLILTTNATALYQGLAKVSTRIAGWTVATRNAIASGFDAAWSRVSSVLDSMGGKWGRIIGQLPGQILGGVYVTAGKVVQTFGLMFTTVGGLVSKGLTGVGKFGTGLAQTVAGAAGKLGPLGSLIGRLGGAAGDALGLVGKVAGGLSQAFGAVLSRVGAVVGVVGSVGGAALGAVGGVVGGVVGVIGQGLAQVAKVAAVGFGVLTGAILATSQALRGLVGSRQFADGTPLDPAQLAAARQGMEAFDSALISLKTLWQQLAIAMAPVLKMVSNFIQSLADRLKPHLPQISAALGAMMEVGIAVFDVLIKGVGQLVTWIGNAANALFGFSDGATSTRDIVINVFQAIGVAGAYAFDIIKAGIGAVAVGIGLMVQGVGAVIDLFAELVALAKKLPDAIKPSWVDKFADGTKRFAATVEGTGKDLRKWGVNAISTFGDSAKAVRGFFADIRAGKTLPKEVEIKMKPITYVASAAVLKDSTAAASAEAKFKTQAILNPAVPIAVKALEEEKKAVKLLGDIKEGIKAIVGKPLGFEII